MIYKVKAKVIVGTIGEFYRKLADGNVGRVYSRSADAVIRVYDEGGNVIETHEHKGDFKER
jgi:hypothetical protein